MQAVYTIEQLIAAGSNFDGAVPSLGGDAFDAQDSEGKRIYVDQSTPPVQAEGDAGGLFDFPFSESSVLWVVERVLIIGDGTYTLNLLHGAAVIELATGSNPDVQQPVAGWKMGPEDQLQLITAGASAALKVQVVARPFMAKPPAAITG